MGSVKPVFKGKRLSVRIPLAYLGDATALNTAAIVGTLASPSDIVPEFGHLQFGMSALTAAASGRAPALRAMPPRAESGAWRWSDRAAAARPPRIP
jgi:methyl coenzyme M reductase beta subunit